MVCITFIKVLKMWFVRKPAPPQPPIHPETTALEVAGGFDAFFSLEDLDPDLDWHEALAAAWGLPYPEAENR
jgi:hypothetical protein